MRLASFLCLGGQEITNLSRLMTYGACEFFDSPCPCPALEVDTFVSPTADPAPWYDAAIPESEDFLGLLTQSVTLSVPGSRAVTATSLNGSIVGPERLRGRVIEVVGWLVARTPEAMWYAERWLSEVLRGDRCEDCAHDELQVLPYCRDEDGYDYAQDFRTLVGTALVDGPRFTELSDDPSYFVATTQFQFASATPYLFSPADPVIAYEMTTDAAGGMTVPEWVDGGTFVIDMVNEDTVDATDILIEGRISLDGSCPVTGLGTSVPASWSYPVPTLGPGDRLTIDGRRGRVTYYDASCKQASPGYSLVDFTGPWKNPDAGPCTTMCVEASIGTGAVMLTVDGYLRSL